MNCFHRRFERFLSNTAHTSGFKVLYSKLINLGNFLGREASRPKGCSSIDPVTAVTSIFPKMRVMHGPFRGMKYNSAESHGSSLFPKLLGSYERELHSIINSFIDREYNHIVDVGCAEGYYAVGLALLIPEVNVYAYDISSVARELCAQMAQLNRVSDRIEIRECCSPQELVSLDLEGRSLVICDCEGYEKQLLTPDVVKTLQNHDFLIEAHDFMDRTISPALIDAFSDTHHIELIGSVSDHLKPRLYEYEELAEFDMATRYELLKEQRLEHMNWFYMQSRS